MLLSMKCCALKSRHLGVICFTGVQQSPRANKRAYGHWQIGDSAIPFSPCLNILLRSRSRARLRSIASGSTWTVSPPTTFNFRRSPCHILGSVHASVRCHNLHYLPQAIQEHFQFSFSFSGSRTLRIRTPVVTFYHMCDFKAAGPHFMITNWYSSSSCNSKLMLQVWSSYSNVLHRILSDSAAKRHRSRYNGKNIFPALNSDYDLPHTVRYQILQSA
jgi:hypothetical protein